MFNSFQGRDGSYHQKPKDADKTVPASYDGSRNNLKPIRTFGRDITNIHPPPVIMADRLQNPKRGKIKLKYPKNSSASRRNFGFDVSKQIGQVPRKPSVIAKRYISSSSLTDRNK